MNIDLWAVEGPFLLNPPIRPAGFVLFGLLLIGTLAFVIPPLLRRERLRTPLEPGEASLLAALIFIAPLAQLLISIKFQQAFTVPGVPLEPVIPGFSLLGSIPWMVAAGLMGAPHAALVAFAGGLASGGWITHSLITPLSLAFQASLTAWLLTIPYKERLSRAIRHPLVAAVIASVVYGIAGVVERFSQTGGSLYDGLDFGLALLPFVLLGALTEGVIAGTAGTILRQQRREDWRRPQAQRTAPYNQNLAARMLSVVLGLGLASVIVLAGGQWLLARGAVRDLVAENMRQRTEQAGDAIPFFIQSGRRSIQTQANQLSGGPPSEVPVTDWLQANSQGLTFFSQLAFYDESGQISAVVPEASLAPSQAAAVHSVLTITLQGVPQEVIAPPTEAQAQGAHFIFLAPVSGGENGDIVGALAGWTTLDDHPLLNPILGVITDAPHGETFLVDDRGQILIHAAPSAVLGSVALPIQPSSEVELAAAPDGTRRLEYWHSVPGYSWQIVSFVPQRLIDRMAIPIASRLTGVLVAVGILFLAFVYWSSQRITQPLRQMTEVARSIAAGDLDQPVSAQGEDEVGRLAASFERMRQGLKSRLNQMDLLLTVSRSLASQLEIEESLPDVLEGLRELANADVARVALSQEAADWVADPSVLASGTLDHWSTLDRQIWRLVQGRGSFTLDNPARARAVLDLEGIDDPPGALMAAPVREEDNYLGALWLGRFGRRAFSPADQDLLSIIAAQLGLWLSNVALYQQAEEERERLAALLEVTPDAVIAVGPEGKVSLANKAAEPFLSVARDAVAGTPAEQAVAQKAIRELLLGEVVQEQTEEIVLENGQVWSAVSREIWAGGWRSVGRVCVLWDISHYRRLDMLKSEFVATVSHDLRAPLTLMRGYGTMISMVGALNEQQKEFIAKILDSIDGMSQLVENLLDLGRIEAGMGLELDSVHLPDLVEDVLETYRPSAANKRVGLEVEVPAEMEKMKADPTLLRQAIANLVDNAIKFTPGGGTVRLRAEQAEGEIQFEVQDTGVGIAPADQPRLFERFYRARRPENLKTRGSGLGLAIVKSIIEQHGGSVAVESRLGSGSTFSFHLPMDASQAVEAPA